MRTGVSVAGCGLSSSGRPHHTSLGVDTSSAMMHRQCYDAPTKHVWSMMTTIAWALQCYDAPTKHVWSMMTNAAWILQCYDAPTKHM